MRHMFLIARVAMFSMLAVLPGCERQVGGEDLTQARIVIVGDSITDGGTYQLLIAQALREAAGGPSPVLINAGICGDKAKGVRNRLERDVLAYQPTLVTLSIGINDTMQNVPMDEYKADVLAVVEHLRAEKIPLVLFTLTPIGPTHAEKEASRAEKNVFLRETATKYGLLLVDVDAAMRQAQADGINVLEGDEIHISYAGYRVFARAILDGLGQQNIKLPDIFTPAPLPGLITDWQVLPFAEEKPAALTMETVQAVQPDAQWKTLTLPLTAKANSWWWEQERQRGMVYDLAAAIGPAKGCLGYTTITADKAKQVYFNTGIQLQAIWLNGECIYRFGGEYTGWHPGKERIAAQLQAGTNVVVIECDGGFSLNVTADRLW